MFAPGSSEAPPGWKDDTFVELLNRGARTANVEEAAVLYARADELLAEQAPVAFLAHREEATLIKPYVKGYLAYGSDFLGLSRQPERVYVTMGVR